MVLGPGKPRLMLPLPCSRGWGPALPAGPVLRSPWQRPSHRSLFSGILTSCRHQERHLPTVPSAQLHQCEPASQLKTRPTAGDCQTAVLGSFTLSVHSPRWPARLRQQLQQGRFITAIPVTREGTRGAARTSAFSPDPSSRCPSSSSPSLCSVHVSSSEPPLWASLLSSRWTGKHRPGGQRHG